ncbi:amino acid adenylation domain-containing protein [Pseudoalteromonas neustonica]|uniref:Amino acid adenylation domain-containing protein n=1 Tax=Pseudoalteromonas neustonica TaxID=1840331 RepID=A0ABU9U047_9GAMM
MAERRVRKRDRLTALSDTQKAQLAQRINNTDNIKSELNVLAKRIDTSVAVTLTAAQKRLWTAWKLSPQDPAYNLAGSLSFKGRLDGNLVQACFSELVQRHGALNVRFEEHDELGAVQVWRNDAAFEFTHKTVEEKEASAKLTTLAQQPFDLTKDLLLKVALLESDKSCQLLVVMHHIVTDGTSMQMLFDQFMSLYGAKQVGQTANLKASNIDFLDYASWLNAKAPYQGEYTKQLNKWQDRLQGDFEPLALPANNANRQARGYEISHSQSELDLQTWQDIQGLAKSLSVTPFLLLLSVFQLLQHRYSAHSIINVGVPVANRHRAETLGLVGFFVNTQLNQLIFSECDTFRSLLNQAQDFQRFAQGNQDLPFDDLVNALNVERTTGIHPLFQVMFNYLRRDRSAIQALNGVELVDTYAHRFTMPFDLQLDVIEVSEGLNTQSTLTLNLYYAKPLYSQDFAEQCLEDVKDLLCNVREHLNTPLANSQWHLGSSGLKLSKFGKSAAADEFSQGVLSQIQQQVNLNPDKPALTYEHESLSYAQFDAKCNQLAHYLIDQHIYRESKAGVLMTRSPEMVISLHAIMRAGAAYVPLDPSLPVERLNYIIEQSGLSLIISNIDVPELALGCQKFNALALDEFASCAPKLDYFSNQAAYAIFTSGSTGKPKGVLNTHEALANRIRWQQRAYPLTGDDIVLQKTPFGFDVSVWEFFWPFMYGARLVVAPPEVHKEPMQLAQTIEQHQVNVLHFVPSMLKAFADSPFSAKCTSISRILCSGEVLGIEVVEACKQQLPNASIHNLYGPTEAAIDVSYFDCDSPITTSVPIGEAIQGIELYVLDSVLNTVPVNAMGELYISGIGLARGYVGRADLTAERFLASPFSERGERLYRTGDLVRWREDGKLIYLGRIDDQVKLNGLRIELDEIQHVLLSLPEVLDAAVTVSKTTPAQLLGHLVFKDEVNTDEIAQKLSELLPAYMVPRHFHVLTQLPVNHNGKLDRKALNHTLPQTSREFSPPITEMEVRLAAIWTEVLSVEKVGRDDRFYDLGGDSIAAIKIVGRCQNARINLAPTELFSNLTLAECAQSCASQDTQALIPALQQTLKPLSYAQLRMWVAYQLAPSSDAYHIAGYLNAKGHLAIDLTQQVFTQLLTRHSALGCRFVEEHDIIMQQLGFYQEIDLVKLTDHQAAKDWVSEPFDLLYQAPIRIALVPGVQGDTIYVVMHHIIADGWSLDLLLSDFATLYKAASTNSKNIPVQTLSDIDYGDYAAWQRSELQAEKIKTQTHYWQQTLGGEYTPLTLPRSQSQLTDEQFEQGELTAHIEHSALMQLKSLATELNASVFSVLMAAWQLALAKYSGAQRLHIGVPASLRSSVQTQNMVGLFVNTLVIRGDINAQLSLPALIGRCNEQIKQAQQNQDVPYEQVIKACSGANNSELFDAMLNHQVVSQNTELDLGACSARIAPLASKDAKLDLVLHSTEIGEQGIQLTLHFNASKYDASLMQRVLKSFQLILSMAKDFDEKPIDQVLQARLGFDVPLNHGVGTKSTVDPNILSQLSRYTHSDGVAIKMADSSMSYQSLDEVSNQLAHYLIAQGVEQQQCVGLVFKRSPEMLISLLAVLKVGAVYVPIDPTLPAERQQSIIAQSQLKGILSNTDLKVTSEVPIWDWQQLELTSLATTGLNRASHPEQLAYLLFTSGSTGKPKGVSVTHGGLANYLAFATKTYGMQVSHSLVSSTLSFDATITSLLSPLWMGKTLSLMSTQEHELATLGSEINNAVQPCLFKITPAHLDAMLLANILKYNDTHHVFVVGGDKLLASTVSSLKQFLPNIRVFNEYGPTETVVGCSIVEVSEQYIDKYSVIPITHAIDNTQLYVLSPQLNPCAVGVAGELYIAGEGVARGYINRFDLTAERFIANPFDELGSRLYRTGDLVCWDEDGELTFLGRTDHQVKIKGYRIELGEIDAQLMVCNGVKESVAIVDDSSNASSIIAFVSGEQLEEQLILASLAQHLPNYMLPTTVVILDALPLTHNGKIDRKALQIPAKAQVTFSAPQTALEKQVARLWRELFEREQIGLHDDFFKLGGDSVLALQFIAKLKTLTGQQVPLNALFEHAQLAAFCYKMQDLQDSIAVDLLANHSTQAPAAPNQQSLWVAHQLAKSQGQSDSYNIVGGANIEGELELNLLQSALDDVVKRHKVLQSKFIEQNSDIAAYFDVNIKVTLDYQDVSELGLTTSDINGIQTQFASHKFELDNPPLLAVLLLKLADNKHQLLVNMHHIISDGWSVGILIDELGHFYLAHQQGVETCLAPLEFDYFDYAIWQHSRLSSEEYTHVKHFWTHALDNAPATSVIAPQKVISQGADTRGAFAQVTFSEAQKAQLLTQAKHLGVSLNILLMSGYLLFLHRLTGQKDLIIGIDSAGREHLGLSSLLGYFVKVLPVRSLVNGSTSYYDYVHYIKKQLSDVMTHQLWGLEDIIKLVKPARQGEMPPLIQQLFVLQNVPQGNWPVKSHQVEPLQQVGELHSKFANGLFITDDDELICNWMFRTNMYNEASMQSALEQWQVFVMQLLAWHDAPISELLKPQSTIKERTAKRKTKFKGLIKY